MLTLGVHISYFTYFHFLLLNILVQHHYLPVREVLCVAPSLGTMWHSMGSVSQAGGSAGPVFGNSATAALFITRQRRISAAQPIGFKFLLTDLM